MKPRTQVSGLLALGAVLLLATAFTGPATAQHPNHAQGFRPEHVFQAGGIEHVDLFNGNLTLTIPIGQTYPLGPKLSYSLTLTYTGNVWAWDEKTDISGTTYLQAEPRATSNAGLGWNLSLAKLVPSSDPTNPSTLPGYQTPDQALHQLYDKYLHPNGQQIAGAEFTQDSTYLRFDTSKNQMDLPDGTIQTFGPDGLSTIEDPYGHSLSVEYLSRDAQGDAHDWKITDSYGREHHILFTRRDGRLVVSEVDLEPFGGPPAAVYTFHYADLPIPRACNEPVLCTATTQCGDTSDVTEPVLTEVDLPDGSRYTMPMNKYHVDSAATCGQRAINGQLEGMTLPTGGSFEWDWRVWVFPKASADPGGVLKGNYPDNPFSRSVGLSARHWKKRNGDELGSWTYSPELQQDPTDPAARELVVTVKNIPPGDYTKHYFSAYPGRNDGLQDPAGGWTKYEYGLPFTRRVTDGTSPGRYLSTQVYDKHDNLLRTTYVRYERDGNSKANPRLVSERTVYNDDASHHADVDLSGFDGLGHYRTQAFSGNFTAGTNSRTVYTDFNPGKSISSIPGLSAPWILGTYDLHQVTEGGQTFTDEASFDSATGFLTKMRRRKGASCGSHDVLIDRIRFPTYETIDGQKVLKPDAGFLAREDFYGGDSQSLACGALGSFTLPTQPVYRRKHSYSCGSLATTLWFVPGGSALTFYSTDQDIDCSTGLVSKSRDTAGLATTYDYDTSGRPTKVTPPAGLAATIYTYSNNSATLPARVTIDRKSGNTVLTETQGRFDGFGRVAEERRTMPDGTTSVRDTDWSSRGWIDQKSEWHKDGTDTTPTQFRMYDPFGRPGAINLPDGQQITIGYAGVESRSVTAQVATSLDQATNKPILASATTTEVYDRFGRLARVTEANSTRTSYSYNGQDDLTLVQENDLGSPTQTRSFAYDGRGFLTSESHPELGGQTNPVTYSGYDPLGNPGEIQRGGQDLSYTYDAAARLTAITETGTSRVWKSWTYGTAGSTNGKLVSASRLNRLPYPPDPSYIIEPNVTETYTYGGVGGAISKVETTVPGVGATTDNTQPDFEYDLSYDALGNVTSRTYPQCTSVYCAQANQERIVTQGFTEGLLSSVTGFASSITYHPDGLWKAVTHTNGVTDYQDLDASGMARPGRLYTSGASKNFDTGSYAYDGAGNITEMGTYRYVYDLLSRVQDAQVEVPNPGCGETLTVQGSDSGSTAYQTCGTVQGGPNYTVKSGGNVTFRAGDQIVLENGFSVEQNGRLTLEIDPSLDPAGQPTPAEQSYVYDRFGNLTSVTTSTTPLVGQPGTTRTIATDSSTNRMSGAGYDQSGNVTSWGTWGYAYDPFNMLSQASTAGSHSDFVYGPGDERIWTIAWGSDPAPTNWVETWTLRDLDGTPLRQYRSVGGNESGNWSLDRDDIWRGGSLLATVTPQGTRHLHLDHLGSPRMVTDANGQTLDVHLYYPFGEEATASGQDTLRLKFTGHERDDLDPSGTTYDLDYMHARYYSPQVGRFLSADPVLGHKANPQSWNRFSYTRSNPVKYVDPTGETISLDGLDDTEIQKLLASLEKATGNTYGTDKNNNLVLLNIGTNSSTTATGILRDLIDSGSTFTARACNSCGGIQFEATVNKTHSILIDFADFASIKYGRVTPESFSLGMNFLHEALHALNPDLTDPSQPGETGFFVDQTNKVRQERGFDVRLTYKAARNYDVVTLPFESRGLRKLLHLHNKIQYSYRNVFLGPPPPSGSH